MATYEASVRTSITTASVPFAAFRASTTQRAEIKEIGITQVTAGTSPNTIAIARSTALAVTPGGTSVGLARDANAPATTGQLETTFGTAPTFTAGAFLRRWTFGGTVGSGVVWTFDLTRMLLLPLGNTATGELVFVNANATALPTFDIYICWEE